MYHVPQAPCIQPLQDLYTIVHCFLEATVYLNLLGVLVVLDANKTLLMHVHYPVIRQALHNLT